MRNITVQILALIIFLNSCDPCPAQEVTNAWAGIPELSSTPDSWNYGFSPGWYFWAGGSVSFTFGLYGYVMRFFRRLDMNDPSGGGE